MTLIEGLIFSLSVLTGAVALSVSPGVNRSLTARSGVVIALTALGLNTQITTRAWQSGTLLGVALAISVLPWDRVRRALLVGLAGGGPFLLWPGIAGVAGEQVFTPLRLQILLVTCGFGFSVLGGSVVVEQVLRRIKGLPDSSEEAESDTGAPGGGRAIGMLERAFAYGGVLLGHPEAAALVVAVKSVARFPEFSKQATGRRFAEYFLVGTLLSIGFALGVGYLIRAALRMVNRA
jgi:hypothetical protein